jgi:hypothetical protein
LHPFKIIVQHVCFVKGRGTCGSGERNVNIWIDFRKSPRFSLTSPSSQLREKSSRPVLTMCGEPWSINMCGEPWSIHMCGEPWSIHMWGEPWSIQHAGFFIWGYIYPLPSFLGVHQNFWGCNVPSNSSFGGTKKMNCIFSTQGRAFCILRVIDTGLSLLYRVGENLFFLSDIGSDRNWGFVCLCVCPTILL